MSVDPCAICGAVFYSPLAHPPHTGMHAKVEVLIDGLRAKFRRRRAAAKCATPARPAAPDPAADIAEGQRLTLELEAWRTRRDAEWDDDGTVDLDDDDEDDSVWGKGKWNSTHDMDDADAAYDEADAFDEGGAADARHTCATCLERFETVDELSAHAEMHDADDDGAIGINDDDRMWVCPECSMTFDTRRDMHVHETTAHSLCDA
jgi:hypothetical protein